jgi:hypothetical protein
VITTLAQTVISIVDDPDVAAQARHQFSPTSLLAVAVMRIARPQSWIQHGNVTARTFWPLRIDSAE